MPARGAQASLGFSCGLDQLSQSDTMPLTFSFGCLPVPPSLRWIPLPSLRPAKFWAQPRSTDGGWSHEMDDCESVLLSLCIIRLHAGLASPAGWLPLHSHPHMWAALLSETALCPKAQNNPGQRTWGLSSSPQSGTLHLKALLPVERTGHGQARAISAGLKEDSRQF